MCITAPAPITIGIFAFHSIAIKPLALHDILRMKEGKTKIHTHVLIHTRKVNIHTKNEQQNDASDSHSLLLLFSLSFTLTPLPTDYMYVAMISNNVYECIECVFVKKKIRGRHE